MHEICVQNITSINGFVYGIVLIMILIETHGKCAHHLLLLFVISLVCCSLFDLFDYHIRSN